MSPLQNLLRWVYLIDLIVEVSFGVVSFLAEADVFYPSPVAWAIAVFVRFAASIAVWMVIAFCCTGGKQRGSALLRADTVYFAITSVIYLIVSLSWLTFLAKSFGIEPLTWTDNPDAFAVYRSIFSRQLTFTALLITFSLFDARYSRLKAYVANKMSSRSAQ